MTSAADLQWLADVLSPGEDGAGVFPATSRDEACDGMFLVVPNRHRPRFLLPAHAPAAASGMLRAHNGLRAPVDRILRRVLAIAVRTGRVDHLVGELIRLRPVGAPAPALLTHVREVLQRDDAMVAVGVPRAGPNRKPVLQVFSPSGRALAFFKLGWNAATARRVRVEADALRRLQERDGAVGAPALLHEGTWRGLVIIATAPLPPGVRRHRRGSLPPVGALREILSLHGDTVAAPLDESPYLQDLHDRIDALSPMIDRPQRAALEQLVGRVSDEDGRCLLRFGTWHGDWVPWNLAWAGPRLYAFDWEHCRSSVPAGLDALHFYFQVAHQLGRQRPPDALRRAVRMARPAIARLDADTDEATRARARLYVLELFTRTHEAVDAGAPATGTLWHSLTVLARHAAQWPRP